MRSFGWALVQYDLGPDKKTRPGRRHRPKMPIYRPKRENSGDTNPADPLILDLQLPELKINLLSK